MFYIPDHILYFDLIERLNLFFFFTFLYVYVGFSSENRSKSISFIMYATELLHKNVLFWIRVIVSGRVERLTLGYSTIIIYSA